MWRLIRPMIVTPRFLPKTISGMPGFFKGWNEFRQMGGVASFADLAPNFAISDEQSGGGHYFYQDTWALRRLAAFGPAEHHDFGSRLDGFVAQATATCAVVYYDIRPPSFTLPEFQYRAADLTALPIADRSLTSVSCLHVVEHVGLGRYREPIDPMGTIRSLRELQRILAPGGQLLVSMPIGRERVEFNAHRIWHPLRLVDELATLQLAEFSVVTDDDVFIEHVRPDQFGTQTYACGLYLFRR